MLTSPQITTLRADVLAAVDAEIVAARAAGDTVTLAALYNRATPDDFWVWRTAVRKNEYTQEVDRDGGTFNWSGTGGYIGRSQGERDAWRELFNGGGRGDGSVNASLANVRAAFADIFSGAGAGAVANRTHLLAMSKRKPTRAERLFAATGAGSATTAEPGPGTQVAPALLTFEGDVTDVDMQLVLAG